MPKNLFQPGVSGNPAGKPKGTKNKFRYDVAEIMQRTDCNPFEILADLAINCPRSEIRCKAAAELASYLAPKLRHIEWAGDADSPLVVTMNFGNNNSKN